MSPGLASYPEWLRTLEEGILEEDHKQVTIKFPFRKCPRMYRYIDLPLGYIRIDKGLSKILPWMWEQGICTIFSCENNYGAYIVVKGEESFDKIKDLFHKYRCRKAVFYKDRCESCKSYACNEDQDCSYVVRFHPIYVKKLHRIAKQELKRGR